VDTRKDDEIGKRKRDWYYGGKPQRTANPISHSSFQLLPPPRGRSKSKDLSKLDRDLEEATGH